MPLIDEGENRIARILFGDLSPDGELWLGLYKNSTEPSESATLGDIVEVSGSGYARKKLLKGSWSIDGNVATYEQQVFKALSDWGDVHGYFIATSADDSGKLMFVEHFSSPYSIEKDKGIKITPKITID